MPDTFAENAAEEYAGVMEQDDILRQIRDLLAMQVSGASNSGDAAEWLSSTVGDDVGILGQQGDSAGSNDRQHFGGRVQIDSGDTRDDPEEVPIPFEATNLDLRDWSGTVYVAFEDPRDSDDNSYYAEFNGSNDDPVAEIPCRTNTLWFASPSGSSATPLVDVWRHQP